MAVAHGESDREVEAAFERGADALAGHDERRAFGGPDRPVGVRALGGPEAQDDEVEHQPPECPRQFDDARIPEELLQVFAQGGRGRFPR